MTELRLGACLAEVFLLRHVDHQELVTQADTVAALTDRRLEEYRWPLT